MSLSRQTFWALLKRGSVHSYGTPFLLSLGLSEELTSLVWLAGPISGLVAQPVIGAYLGSLRVTCPD